MTDTEHSTTSGSNEEPRQYLLMGNLPVPSMQHYSCYHPVFFKEWELGTFYFEIKKFEFFHFVVKGGKVPTITALPSTKTAHQ